MSSGELVEIGLRWIIGIGDFLILFRVLEKVEAEIRIYEIRLLSDNLGSWVLRG